MEVRHPNQVWAAVAAVLRMAAQVVVHRAAVASLRGEARVVVEPERAGELRGGQPPRAAVTGAAAQALVEMEVGEIREAATSSKAKVAVSPMVQPC